MCVHGCVCVCWLWRQPSVPPAGWPGVGSAGSFLAGLWREERRGAGTQGPGPTPRCGTHCRALLILEHSLELGLDLSRDDRREDDRHFDGAEGANLTLCHLHGKTGATGQSGFMFLSRHFPRPHHGLHHHEVSVPGWPGPALRGLAAQRHSCTPPCVYLLSR